MTIRRYYTDPSRLARATVLDIGRDQRGLYALLDATIFHPQGGGQPADTGAIGGVRVIHVAAEADGEIRHYIEDTGALNKDRPAVLAVDEESRSLHERLHTAGHLISSLTELLFPQVEAIAGHHWPGEARVDFLVTGNAVDADSIRHILEPEIRRAISRGPAVYAEQSGTGQRRVVIDGYRPIPCGGTHTKTAAEIGPMEIRSVKLKQETLRIGYRVEAAANIP